jgi:pyruvate formate lyase activating enzyme
VYEGNVHAGAGDTRCPGCGSLLIQRDWHRVLTNRLRDGACPDCGQSIPGRWHDAASGPGLGKSSGQEARYDFLNL